MSLTNLYNAENIKSFVAKCYPTEVLTISESYSGNIKKIEYIDYIKDIRVLSGVPVRCNSIEEMNTDHHWYHDRNAKILYYYYNGESIDVVVTFGFFFKTGDSEPLHIDIDDSDTDIVMYDGRMKETSFIQSIDDVSNGTLAISSTTIALINNDGYYQTLARDEISFKNSYIEVRIFYNIVTNNSIVFTGTVESATFRSKEMILEVKDSNKILQNTAKFTEVESEYITDSTTYPDIPSDKIGKEIPYLLGRVSNVSMEKIQVATKFSTHAVNEPYYVESCNDSWDQGEDSFKIIPISNQAKTVAEKDPMGGDYLSTNVRSRKFLSFRTINSIKTTSSVRIYQGTVVDLNSDKTTSDEFGFEVEVPVSNTDNYFVGQQCVWASSKVWGSAAATLEVWARQICYSRVSYINVKDSRIRIAPSFVQKLQRLNDSLGASYIYFSTIAVSYRDSNKNVYVLPICNSYEEQSLNNGKLQKIEVARYGMNSGFYGYGYTKADNKEWIVGGINVITKPGTPTTNDSTTELDNIDFSCKFMTESTNLSLGCILHRTLLEAGYRTDGGTEKILAAGTNSFRDLDAKLGTTYFTLHTGMVESYLELLQMMLSSVFGFMYVQSDGRVGVRLFEKIPYNSTTWVIGEDDIVADSVISDFNSGGIYTRLKSTNDTNVEFTSEKSLAINRLLHGDILMENKYHFESKEIYESKVLPRKYEYLSNSVRKFDFTIINKGYDILIGDRIEIEFSLSNKWLGYPKKYDLFVISVNKSLQGTTITAFENIFPEL